MALAYDYPLLQVFWTTLLFFLFIAWWVTVIYVVIDVFRSGDLRSIQKACWLVLIFFLPIFGVFTYLIVRGDSMTTRVINHAGERDRTSPDYYQRMV